MNAFGILAAWAIMQVSLFALFGAMCYAIARRRGPSAGSLAALATLVLVLFVSILAVSPWPRWWTAGESNNVAHAVIEDSAASRPSNLPVEIKSDVSNSTPQSEPDNTATTSNWQTAIANLRDSLWQDMQTPAAVPAQPAWRWPAIVGTLIVIGAAFGFIRLCLGLIAVRRYRAQSVPVDDADLLAEVAGLRRLMDCTRPVALRMSHELTSPATIGWRKPLVIVPADWRTWNRTERRVALAHELAHVCRGDYASSVLAQFSLAMNFYHPLVHWLARRLRFEQELAADALAANATANREEYLVTLAQLTLRYDDQRLAWAARSFLPTRGIFLRRIEMLRDPKRWQQSPLSRPAKVLLVALLAVAGLFASGLRGPSAVSAQQAGTPTAKAEAPPAAVPAEAAPMAAAFDWMRYIPADANFAVRVRLATLVKQAAFKPLLSKIDESFGWLGPLQIAAADVDEILLTCCKRADVPAGYEAVAIVRTINPLKQLKPKQIGNEVILVLDERTLAIGSQALRQAVLGKTGEKSTSPIWATKWKSVADAPIAFICDVKQVEEPLLKAFQNNESLLIAAPLWQQTETLTAAITIDDKKIGLQATAFCWSEEGASKVHMTSIALATLATNWLDALADAPPPKSLSPSAMTVWIGLVS